MFDIEKAREKGLDERGMMEKEVKSDVFGKYRKYSY